MHCYRPRQASFTVRMINCGSQYTQLATGGTVSAPSCCDVMLAGLLGYIRDGAGSPKWRERSDCITDALWRMSAGSDLLRVIGKQVCHEDFIRITRPGTAGALMDEF